MVRSSWKRIWLGALAVIAVLVVWQTLSATGMFGRMPVSYSRLLLPPPASVLITLWSITKSGYLLDNVSVSVLRVVVGFLLAAIIAVPLGVTMALVPTIEYLADPLVRLVSPIPGVAWVPIAILWFGLGDEAAIFIIAIGSIFPILINAMQGVRDVDQRLIDAARTMGANRQQILVRVMGPSVIPYLVTGFRAGLSFAWRVVIAAEMVGVPKGLGYMLTVGRSTGQTEITLVTMLVLGLLMIIVEETIFAPIEQYTATWKRQVRVSG